MFMSSSVNKALRLKIHGLYHEDLLSINEICEKLGMRYTYVWRYLTKRTRWYKPIPLRDKVIRSIEVGKAKLLYRMGFSYSAIAKYLGCSKSRAHQYNNTSCPRDCIVNINIKITSTLKDINENKPVIEAGLYKLYLGSTEESFLIQPVKGGRVYMVSMSELVKNFKLVLDGEELAPC